MPEVRFFRENVVCHAEPGENLRLLALRAGVQLYRSWHIPMNCRGKGKCGSCRIEVSNPAAVEPAARTEAEHRFLDQAFSDPATRLACQVQVCADLAVNTQETRRQGSTTRAFIPRGW